MRNKKAKLIKRMVYRKDSPKERKYRQLKENGMVVSDLQRTVYQETKQLCQNKNSKEIKQYLTKEK